ncbi:hypothetical protein GCM10019016_082730 [Streptomyces prasinosporus]|uniref:Uncharacterized protein n=1 Tax=Streptomyces prasinosporus TaxID=68256 RepID=A0ABP6U3R3_9ACTN|nr:hypothetical protein GCM10010332_39620 [Streptomyces albogriseolus]GHG37587.1 hypothetical protein GCM10018777_63220 [Streptomyces viridodiastaticus]
MAPGTRTDLSRSPSATLTAAGSGSTLVGGTDGSSVEDMRQCYETITPWFTCSASQECRTPPCAAVALLPSSLTSLAPGARPRHAPAVDRMAPKSGVS